MQSQIQELVCYIWDNYLQISESAQQIFLLGVGNAYLGVKVLLVNRGEFSSSCQLIYHLTRFLTDSRLQITH